MSRVIAARARRMRSVIRCIWVFAAAIAGPVLNATVASAQDYPKGQPIRMISPFSAGGAADPASGPPEALQNYLAQRITMYTKLGQALKLRME